MESSRGSYAQKIFIKKANLLRSLQNKRELNTVGVCFGLTTILNRYIKENNIDGFYNLVNLIINIPEDQIPVIFENYKRKGNVNISFKGFECSLNDIFYFTDTIDEVHRRNKYKSMMLNWVESQFLKQSDLSKFLSEMIRVEGDFSFCIHNIKHIFSLTKHECNSYIMHDNISNKSLAVRLQELINGEFQVGLNANIFITNDKNEIYCVNVEKGKVNVNSLEKLKVKKDDSVDMINNLWAGFKKKGFMPLDSNKKTMLIEKTNYIPTQNANIFYYDSNNDCTKPIIYSNNEKDISELIENLQDQSLVSTLMAGGYYHVDTINYGNDASLIDEILLFTRNNEHFKNNQNVMYAISQYDAGVISKNTAFLYLINEICLSSDAEINSHSIMPIKAIMIKLIPEKKMDDMILKYPDLDNELKKLIEKNINNYTKKINDIELECKDVLERYKTKEDEIYIRNFINSLLLQIIREQNFILFKATVELFTKYKLNEHYVFCINETRSEDSLLHAACKHGNLEVVNFLCKSDNDMLVKNRKGNTPIYLAGVNGHVDIIKKYLNYLNAGQSSSLFSIAPKFISERNRFVKDLLFDKEYYAIVCLMNAGLKLNNNELVLLPEKIAIQKIPTLSTDPFSLTLTYDFLKNLDSISSTLNKCSIKHLTISREDEFEYYYWDKFKKFISDSGITECEIDEKILPHEECESELKEILNENKSKLLKNANL